MPHNNTRSEYLILIAFLWRQWLRERATMLRYTYVTSTVNTLNAELNRICPLLALLGAHHILHVTWIRVNIIL